jgi:hypothetical protein
MKKIIIYLLLLFTTISANAQFGSLREKPSIYITGMDVAGVSNSAESNKLLSMFEDMVLSAIMKEIKCAKVMSRNAAKSMMQFDRERVIITNEESNINAIADAMGADILICLNVSIVGDDYYLGGTTLDNRKKKVGGKYTEKTNEKNFGDGMNKFANDLVRDLLAMEICAYKGELTFSSVSTYTDSEERTGLPNQDCEFKATKKEDNKTVQTWVFKKDRRYKGSSSVNCTINNSKKETQHNTCVHCCKMENGVKLDLFEPGFADKNSSTLITETYSATKTIPLGAPAEYENYSALIKIKFDILANNYTIMVKAVSEPGKYEEKTEEKNSGCPYDENFEKEKNATYPVSCNMTFGPFPGSPYIKSLKQTITRNYTDPDSKGKGKTVETISFNLTR